jgi:cell division septum initiation protein DivIVA
MSLMSQAEPRLTPDVVQSASFPTARLGRRGLDEERVRAFCQQVEAELVMLAGERAALQEEVSRLRRRVMGRPDGDEAGPSREDAHVQSVSILCRAQQTAHDYVAEAQEYSRHVAQDARRRRSEILWQTRSYADRVVAEAHREAGQAAQTAMAAPLFPPGQLGLLAAPVPQPPDEAREMAGERAYLDTFGEVFQERLRSYLDALLRDAGDRELAPAPSQAAARAGAGATAGSAWPRA